MNYQEYERRKAELQKQTLTNAEYEQKTKEICDELEGEE